MKKGLFVVLLMAGLSACSADHQTVKESQRDAMIDSMVALRMEEISRQAAEDLDRRRSIEVKAKADSIVAARSSIQPAPAGNTPPPAMP